MRSLGASLILLAALAVSPAVSAAERKPLAVAGLVAKPISHGAELSWRVPRGAKWRRVIVEQRTGGRWKAISSRPVRAPFAVVNGLKPGARHHLRVRVRTGRGHGPARRVSVIPLGIAAAAEQPPASDPARPSGTLPLMTISTEGGQPILDRENYVEADWSLDPLTTPFAALSGELEIRGRGNMTWLAAKKPYRIKLSKKAPLLGMKSNRHFALLADAYDHTSMRNELAEFFGGWSSLEWTPAVEHLEVVLNGDYIGLYTLVEVVRIDDDRVQSEQLFEVDWRWENEGTEQGFRTTEGVGVVLKEPEEASSEEFESARELVQNFEDALMGDDFADPEHGYAQHIDLDSWVDWYLIEELMLNADAFISSTYMSVGADGKLRLGPMWDHDLTFGQGSGVGPEQRYIGQRWWHVWIVRMLSDPAFVDRLRARWLELRPMVEAAQQRVAVLAPYLSAAAAESHKRWGYFSPGGGFEKSVAAVSSFLNTRAAYLDTNL